MSDTITVRKNWKKKIHALTADNKFTVYTLSHNFVGQDSLSDDLYKFVKMELLCLPPNCWIYSNS